MPDRIVNNFIPSHTVLSSDIHSSAADSIDPAQLRDNTNNTSSNRPPQTPVQPRIFQRNISPIREYVNNAMLRNGRAAGSTASRAANLAYNFLSAARGDLQNSAASFGSLIGRFMSDAGETPALSASIAYTAIRNAYALNYNSNRTRNQVQLSIGTATGAAFLAAGGNVQALHTIIRYKLNESGIPAYNVIAQAAQAAEAAPVPETVMFELPPPLPTREAAREIAINYMNQMSRSLDRLSLQEGAYLELCNNSMAIETAEGFVELFEKAFPPVDERTTEQTDFLGRLTREFRGQSNE